MNIFFKIILVILNLSLHQGITLAQKVKYFAPEAHTAPVIDGVGDDECWDAAEWALIDQEWFGKPLPDSTDFYGRYKAVWTPERLYLLVEITDDVFNDDIEDPLDRYWEDDCLEIFIDEDKSGGDHRCCANAYNAFAYHVSPITLDVVDLSGDGDFVPKLFNDHIDIAVIMEGDFATMEMAIKIYNDQFSEHNATNPIETLYKGKIMGFSLAYCDDDGNGRENFIGTQPGGLDSWINADLFGEMELIANTTNTDNQWDGTDSFAQVNLYPNPASEFITVRLTNVTGLKFEIIDIAGRVIKQGTLAGLKSEESIDISEIKSGYYIFKTTHDDNTVQSQLLQIIR